MIYITFTNHIGLNDHKVINSSSGHIFSYVISAFCYSVFLDAQIAFHSSWTSQQIFTEKSLLKYTSQINNLKLEKINMNFDLEKINIFLNQINEDKFFDLKNIGTFHIKDLCRINVDIYKTKLKPLLREIYFNDHLEFKLDKAVIHIRKGDLSDDPRYKKFNLKYYKNIINIIKNKYNILVICEKMNYGNVSKLKDCEIIFGDEDDISRDFNYMVNAKVLITACSCFSLAAGYLNQNNVYYDKQFIGIRGDLFERLSSVPNFICFNDLNHLKTII